MNAKRVLVFGGTTALLLCASLWAAPSLAEQVPGKKTGLEGMWLGTLKTTVDLRVLFKIERKGEGWTGTMDSLDQGVKGIPIKKIEFKEDSVLLELPAIAATFSGDLAKDGQSLSGTFTQAGKDIAMKLARIEKVPDLRRPQEPKRPFPYLEEEVTFENKKAGVKFAGTLTLPKGKGPFAAAVLLTGSGPQDRDNTMLGHKSFLLLADYLTRKGIAVLRMDDRGVGGSTGSIPLSTTEDFADDALAAAEFLKGRKEIEKKRIGFIGHSEGGIVGPLAASRNKEIAFVIMLGGTGLPGAEVMYLQGQAALKAAGITDAKVLANQRAIQEVMFTAAKEKDTQAALKKFEQLYAALVATLSDADKKIAATQEKSIRAQMTNSVLSRWFRFFLSHDPRPALRQVQCPVLALFGGKDIQVTAKENIPAVTAALKEGGNKDFTIKELPGLNHLFQTCKTGAVSEYAQIEETLAPVVLETIGDWLLKRVKAEGK